MTFRTVFALCVLNAVSWFIIMVVTISGTEPPRIVQVLGFGMLSAAFAVMAVVSRPALPTNDIPEIGE